MRIHHVLDRVGNHLARRKTVEHSIVPHRDAVIDGDGVEFLRHSARLRDFGRDELSQIFQVNVPGHKLRKRVGNGDDGLSEIAVLHSGGAPQTARPRPYSVHVSRFVTDKQA